MKTSSRSSKRKSKHSQKRSKKKTRSSSEKTKKLKQRDQLESFTDEASVSNSPVSCSSPMDETRTKKRSRSSDRKHRKDKKRSKKSCLARENSGDSGDESPRVKKRKRLKKKGGSDSRKKRSVKRRKRDQSVSSSSRSRSSRQSSDEFERECEGKEDKVELKERKGREKRKERTASKKSRDKSRRFRSACEPNDHSERDYEGKEEKVESKERKGRENGKERSARKRSRDRSRSCSPSKLHCESNSYCSEEKELEKNNPKRLKSVIVVMKDYETDVARDLGRDDGHKDEIVCDFDDYPSKSNDSNDGVSGREVVSYSHEISSVKRSLEDPNSETVASDIRASEVPEIQSRVAEGSGGMTSSLVRSGVDDPLMGMRSEVSIDNASSMSDDLETVLRQKALENLLKRQGKLSTRDDKKTNLDIELKKPSIVKGHSVNHHKSLQKVGPTDSSGPSEGNDGHLLSLRKENAHPEEKGKAPGDFVNNRPNVGLSTRTSTRKEPLGAKNTWRRQLIPQEPSQINPSSPREMIVNDSKQHFNSKKYSQPNGHNLSAPQETMSKDSTKDSASPICHTKGSAENVDAVTASEPSASGERSTNDKTNETDEDAQFQQKTMSVMRGGEMVQVSYKVYIPKKIPALARRQLKR